MSKPAILGDWLDAARGAATEVATTALACSSVDDAAGCAPALQSPFGAYVPLVAAGCQVQIGVVAEWAACQALARALFGMDPDAEFETESDVSDALGEIANMIAGCVKTRMNERTSGLNTGLPLCVSGHVEPSAGSEHGSVALRFDAVSASVRVLLSSTDDPANVRARAHARAGASGG